MKPPLLCRWACICCCLAAVVSIFASETPENLWHFTKHSEVGGGLTLTAEMLDWSNAPPKNVPWSQNWEVDRTPPAKLFFHTGSNTTVGAKYTVGYYRGPLYTVHGPRKPFSTNEVIGTNYVSIFTTSNRTSLVVAIDRGPTYTSTNSGVTWSTVTSPGMHEFPMAVQADGSGFFAHVPVEQPASPTTNAPAAEWYAVGSSADGSKLVLSANPSEPTPFLNIRYSGGRVTVAWPEQFSSFVLEHSADLGAGTWTAVTNALETIDGENRVDVPRSIGNHFFRLRKQ